MPTSRPAPLLVISGAAGTGKTTLGQAWSRAIGAHLVDLDVETVDIVRRMRDERPNMREPEVLRFARDRRYERLVEAIADARARRRSAVVAVAPFTLEISSAATWNAFVDACGAGHVDLVWLWLSADQRAQRIEERGASRDRGRADLDRHFPPPVVPHVALPAGEPIPVQMAILKSQFGNGPFI